MNMSGDKEQEYFSEGLTEALLNSLARINEPQVAARTSSSSFTGEHPDIATVVHRLNVAAVLEESVRRSGQTQPRPRPESHVQQAASRQIKRRRSTANVAPFHRQQRIGENRVLDLTAPEFEVRLVGESHGWTVVTERRSNATIYCVPLAHSTEGHV
jgi:hypothetical protein